MKTEEPSQSRSDKTFNYLLGRSRQKPEIEHVPTPAVKEPDEQPIPKHLKKFSIYAAKPEELANILLEKAQSSHMKTYIQRGKKTARLEKGIVTKPYTPRRKKPQSNYVTKQAKLNRIQHVPISRALVIDRILQSK